MRDRVASVLIACAALAAGCAGNPELEGAAAARSLGASVEGDPPVEAKPAAPSKPVNPWLDDATRIANVNGKVITIRQVRQKMGPSYEQYLDHPEDLARLVHARARDLVEQQVVVEEAKRVGLRVTDEDMEWDEEQQEKEAAKKGDTVDQYLHDVGMTRREWDENRRNDIYYGRARYYFTGAAPARFYAEDRFRPSVDTFVTTDEVRAFGEAHRSEIETPETATIRVIDLRRDSFREAGTDDEEAWRRCGLAMDAVEERLRAGEPFADVARQVSEGPEASRGGLCDPFGREGSILSAYREWAFAGGRTEGEVSRRMRLPTGYILLRLEKHEAARSPSIEEWGPGVRASLLELKRRLAWAQVLVRLLGEASIAPAAFRDMLLEESRAAVRALSRQLPSVQPPRVR